MQNNKAKAEEIVNRFYEIEFCQQHSEQWYEGNICYHQAQKCALIFMDGVIEELLIMYGALLDSATIDWKILNSRINQYKAIRSEIENLV